MNKSQIRKQLIVAAKVLDEIRFAFQELGGEMTDYEMDLPEVPDTDSESALKLEERHDFYSNVGSELEWGACLDEVIDNLCEFAEISRDDLVDYNTKETNAILKVCNEHGIVRFE